MAEQRVSRYYTYDGERRSLIYWSHASNDADAAEYGRTHGAWNVVREDGPRANPTAHFVWKRETT